MQYILYLSVTYELNWNKTTQSVLCKNEMQHLGEQVTVAAALLNWQHRKKIQILYTMISAKDPIEKLNKTLL